MLRHAVLLLIIFVSGLLAQEYRATLTGRVTDPSGAAVPNASVVAVKSDTNSRFETHTATDGFYTLPQLQPGTYELTVEASGFKKYQQTGITISTNQRVGQDVQLELGSTNQSVVVQADASLLDTETASSGQVITTREVENLPVNGRSPMSLAYLDLVSFRMNRATRSGRTKTQACPIRRWEGRPRAPTKCCWMACRISEQPGNRDCV